MVINKKAKKKSSVWLIKVNQNSDSIFYTIVACVLQWIPLMSKKGTVTRVHMLPFLSNFHSTFGLAKQLKAGWSSGTSAFIGWLLPLTQIPAWLGRRPGIHSRSFRVKLGVSNLNHPNLCKGTEVRVVFLNHQSLYIPGPGQAAGQVTLKWK